MSSQQQQQPRDGNIPVAVFFDVTSKWRGRGTKKERNLLRSAAPSPSDQGFPNFFQKELLQSAARIHGIQRAFSSSVW